MYKVSKPLWDIYGMNKHPEDLTDEMCLIDGYLREEFKEDYEDSQPEFVCETVIRLLKELKQLRGITQ